jgi:GH24 family phage-related lysozyme (muramidase)
MNNSLTAVHRIDGKRWTYNSGGEKTAWQARRRSEDSEMSHDWDG